MHDHDHFLWGTTAEGMLVKAICQKYRSFPKRVRDSLSVSAAMIGLLSTIMSVIGITLKDIPNTNILISFIIVVAVFILAAIIAYVLIGRLYSNSISLFISGTPIEITYGDIFETPGYKVIACDTRFDTRVDDVVISKNSLHGKLVLEHGDEDTIRNIVDKESWRAESGTYNDGLYSFPLGTIIRYDSSKDGQTYLMLAMTELDKEYKAHTNMGKYEMMLMKMWNEIDRVYASNDIVLPVLGTGISRFDDGPKSKDDLLRCMLCTFKSSGVSLNATIKIVIYDKMKNIPLYEYKDLESGVLRR